MKTKTIKCLKRRILTVRANQYGNIGVKDGKDKDGKIVHVSGQRLSVTCKAQGIDFRKAFDGFYGSNSYTRSNLYITPRFDGVFIDARDKDNLLNAIAERDKKATNRNKLKELKLQRRRAAAEKRREDEENEKEAYRNSLPIIYTKPEYALSDVCAAMFNLNRYCKYDKCCLSISEVYSYKNALIEHLYLDGYAFEVYHHVQSRDEKECWSCDGSGFHYSGEECWKCSGTGIYQSGGDYVYVVFRFKVGDKIYTWHQPKARVTFEYKVTADEKEMPDLNHQATDLTMMEIKMALILVEWFIECVSNPMDKAA